MHVILDPARGLVCTFVSHMWAPGSGTISRILDHGITYGSRADFEAWGIIDRTVWRHLQVRVGLRILRHGGMNRP